MTHRWLFTATLLVGFLAAAPAGFPAGSRQGAQPGAQERALAAEESLAGRLLVASGKMGDPRFDRTVIYMIDHDAHGAMGLVVNVPLRKIPLAALMARQEMDPEGPETLDPETLDPEGLDPETLVTVFYGGPVAPGRGFFLHSTDLMLKGSRALDEFVALTTRPEALRALARGEGPAQSLFILGYSGWGPGQLESELARDAWFVVPAKSSLVFAEDPARSWERAVAQRTIDL